MISVITTFRGVDEFRLENLYAVEKFFHYEFPNWQMVIVEQDIQSTIDTKRFSGNPLHQMVYNPGPFNKSWGLNVGYQLSDGEVLVITDADMLLTADDLERAVAAIEHSMDIVRPYHSLIDMSFQQTKTYIETNVLPEQPETAQGFDRSYVSETICLAGGVFVIRRVFFETIGGCDEAFFGWGGEDDALSIRAEALTSKSVISRDAKAWHLWHPRMDNYGHQNYKSNLSLVAQYYACTAEQHRQFAAQAISSIGAEDKFIEVEDDAE